MISFIHLYTSYLSKQAFMEVVAKWLNSKIKHGAIAAVNTAAFTVEK